MEALFQKLDELIEKYDNFIILAHKAIDLDAYGSALALYKIIEAKNKTPYLLLDKKQENNAINKSISLLIEKNISINYMHTINKTIDNVLVIILDTNKKELMENPSIIDMYKDIIIIDHHVENNNSISDYLFKYVDNEVSSTTEIIVEYLKFSNIKIDSIIASILLAGLVIDTNSFNNKTTYKTHETASYLLKIGASNVEKQELLKQDKESYFKRQYFIKKSYMIKDNIAICLMDNKKYKRYELALISEDLLQFDKVEASFTIGFIEKNIIGISSRSIGTIDVEKYMRCLGGGGHKTDAACNIRSRNLLKVQKKLIKIIKKLGE